MHDFLLLIVSLSYLGSTLLLYVSMRKSAQKARNASIFLAALGAVLHAAAVYLHWIPLGENMISIFNVLSLCALVIVALQLLSLTQNEPLYPAGLITLPLAALIVAMELTIPAPGNLVPVGSTTLSIHILSAVMAFGVLSIAAVYAFFVALIDYFLRHHTLNRFVQNLPGLVILERQLFQLITIGFTVLTLTLALGLSFVNDLFAQHLAHKAILALMAWMIFGILLWGRQFRGWRGRLAVGLTLAGVTLLVLAYFGSKFVLELVLGSSWQS